MANRVAFTVPEFVEERGKLEYQLRLEPAPHRIVKKCDEEEHGAFHALAIARDGIPSKIDGTYVFAAYIEKMEGHGFVWVGLTSCATDKTLDSSPGDGVSGVSLGLTHGGIEGGNGDKTKKSWEVYKYLPAQVTRRDDCEIVVVFTVRNGGTVHELQFIANGVEGAVVECPAGCFDMRKPVVFPAVALTYDEQSIEMISFDKVKSRSPKIDELMKIFQSNGPNTALIEAATAGGSENKKAVKSSLDEKIERKKAECERSKARLQKLLSDLKVLEAAKEKESGQRRQRNED